MKKVQIIISLALRFTLFSGLIIFLMGSCKKDDQVNIQEEVNTIELTAPTTVSSTAAVVNITGRILEFSTKHIAKIQYYYILNTNEYTKRVVVDADFSRDASKTYFGNILAVTVDGQIKDKNYAVPYNQYTLKLTVPLAAYQLKKGNYFYAGIEILTVDGKRFVNAKMVTIE